MDFGFERFGLERNKFINKTSLLFFKTFKAKLVEARPLEVARRLRLSADQLRYLDKISPLPFVKPAPLAKPKQYERVSSREKPEEQVEGMAS